MDQRAHLMAFPKQGFHDVAANETARASDK